MARGRNVTSRPGLDQKPLPRPTENVLACPLCGQPGRLCRFTSPSYPAQVHVVHDFVDCAACGAQHPKRVCVLPTWPPTPGSKFKVHICKAAGAG